MQFYSDQYQCAWYLPQDNKSGMVRRLSHRFHTAVDTMKASQRLKRLSTLTLSLFCQRPYDDGHMGTVTRYDVFRSIFKGIQNIHLKTIFKSISNKGGPHAKNERKAPQGDVIPFQIFPYGCWSRTQFRVGISSTIYSIFKSLTRIYYIGFFRLCYVPELN